MLEFIISEIGENAKIGLFRQSYLLIEIGTGSFIKELERVRCHLWFYRPLFCLHFPGSEYGKNQPKAQNGSKGITNQAQQGGDGNGVDTEKIDRKYHHLLSRI